VILIYAFLRKVYKYKFMPKFLRVKIFFLINSWTNKNNLDYQKDAKNKILQNDY